MDAEEPSCRSSARKAQPMQITSDEVASRHVILASSSLRQNTTPGLILALDAVPRGMHNTHPGGNLSPNPNSPDFVESSQTTRRTGNAIKSCGGNDMVNRGSIASSGLPPNDENNTTSFDQITCSDAKKHFIRGLSLENACENRQRPPSPMSCSCSGNLQRPRRLSHEEYPQFCPNHMKERADKFRAAEKANRRQLFRIGSNSFSTDGASASRTLSDITGEVNNQETGEVTAQVKLMEEIYGEIYGPGNFRI